jgi:hypothetical protein
VGVLTTTYILFQGAAYVQAGRWFFIALLISTLLVGALTRFDLLTIGVALVLLQQTYPFGTGAYDLRNWIGGDLFGVSMVYFLVLALGVLFIYRVIQSRSLRTDSHTAVFTAVILIGILIADVTYVRQFAYDVVILGVIPLVSMYMQNVQNKRQRRNLASVLLIAPVALIWGDVVLVFISSLIGVQLYPRLTTIQLLLVAVLLGICFEREGIHKHVRYAYVVTTAVFLVRFVWSAARINSGSIVLIGIALATAFGLSKRWRATGFDSRVVATMAIGVAGSVVLLFFNPSLVPTYIVYKIASLVVSLVELDLQGMAHSPVVRIIELVNTVFYELRNGVVHLLFGMGPGGYFEDIYLPFETYVELGRADYSAAERQMEKFFNPHNTPGYALLKTGIVGLITIAVVASTAGREYFNRKGPAAVLALALFFTLGAVFGYGVKNQIIIGVTLGFLTFESAS